MTNQEIVDVLKKMLPLLWDGAAERPSNTKKFICDCAHSLWCKDEITADVCSYIQSEVVSPSIDNAVTFESYLEKHGYVVYAMSDAEIQSMRRTHVAGLIAKYSVKATPVVKVSDVLKKVRDTLWDGVGPQTDETHRRRYICHVIENLEDISRELKNTLKAEVTDRRMFNGCFENYLFTLLGEPAARALIENKKLLQSARKHFVQRWIDELVYYGE